MIYQMLTFLELNIICIVVMITIVYGSILPPTFLYQRKKSESKQPWLHQLGILRNVNNFYKIVDICISNIFNIFFNKKWEIMLLNYFHEYAILLHPNFSVLTVDQASPLSVKRSEWGECGLEEEAPFQRNEATICHLPYSGPVIGKWR
jgi:hypothetical protein